MATTQRHLPMWRAFQVAQAAAVERIEAELFRNGVPAQLAWYDVLMALEAAPGQRLRMRDLAPQVVITRSWLSRVVDRMEAQQLVSRAGCPEDRRGAFVELGDRGRDLLQRVRPVYEAAVEEAFGRHIDDPAALRVLLDRVATGPPAG